jgi:ABC-2 type transport system permease protein
VTSRQRFVGAAPVAALSHRRLLAVARKEVTQLRRDSRSLIMAFVVPAFLTLMFGYVMNFDVKHITLAVLDRSHTQESRRFVDTFGASGYFTLARYLEGDAEIEPLLQRGAARIVLVIPPDFARHPTVQAIVDGGDANTAAIAINYAQAITASWDAPAHRRTGAQMGLDTRVWYNEELKSSNMVVPGLIAVIMMIIAAMLTALTIAREWERGTMEQLAATPVHPVEVIIGKLIPYFAIGMFDVVVAIVIGLTVFKVPFRGDPFFLFVTTSLFLLGALGLGIFISAAIKSQLLATQAAMIATYLPSLLLSGLMFDIASMPKFLQLITVIVPARYFVTVLRGVFLKGVGFPVLWMQALGMLLFAFVGLSLAVRAFRKEIA